jgi:hypothetical protein
MCQCRLYVYYVEYRDGRDRFQTGRWVVAAEGIAEGEEKLRIEISYLGYVADKINYQYSIDCFKE